jgi:hypothetical protein
MRMKTYVALGVLLAAPATAQQPAAITEQSIERGLTNLGLMAAHAFQCTPEPDRPATRQRLLAFHSGLVAEMGSNAAFRFAIAFGAGATHEVDRNSCDRSLADWSGLVQQHRLDR